MLRDQIKALLEKNGEMHLKDIYAGINATHPSIRGTLNLSVKKNEGIFLRTGSGTYRLKCAIEINKLEEPIKKPTEAPAVQKKEAPTKKAEEPPAPETTKEEFMAYEAVRSSGATNMFNIKVVQQLSGLKRDKILCIMKTYDHLNTKYPDVRKGD